MAERKLYDPGLVAVGELLRQKRLALGGQYKTREAFISSRSKELFNNCDWISLRHLTNIELGKNWISIEKLIPLAAALEIPPEDLLSEMIQTYNANKKCD